MYMYILWLVYVAYNEQHWLTSLGRLGVETSKGKGSVSFISCTSGTFLNGEESLISDSASELEVSELYPDMANYNRSDLN